MAGGEGRGVGWDDDGRERRRRGVRWGAVKEQEGGVEMRNGSVPEAEISGAGVDGGGGGGDRKEDAAEGQWWRRRRRRLNGGERGGGWEVEVVEIEEEEDGEYGGEEEEKVPDA